MSLNRAELLQVAHVAYHNIIQTGIGPKLAEANYDEDRRLASLQRATALQTKWEAQQVAKGLQLALTQRITESVAVCRQEFIAFKQAVRTVDRLAGTDFYTRLNLKGNSPQSQSSLVAIARMVYNTVLANADMLQALSGLGYTQIRLGELLQGLADLEALDCQQEKAKGDYQGLTQEVLALEKAVRDDLAVLKAVVKTVFTGEEERQVLESLRLN